MPDADTTGLYTRHRIMLAVGSNIDPENNIARARDILAAEQNLLGESSWHKTAPDGYQAQADFINGAFYIETDLDRVALKTYLRNIEEKRLGRVRGPIKSGPRTMDLDIIVWDGCVIDEEYYKKSYIKKPIDELCKRFGLVLEDQA